MKYSVLIPCILVASILSSVQLAKADSCPIRIEYAGLVGIGAQHGTAEYELSFGPDRGSDTGPFTVNVTATMGDGSQKNIVVDGVSTAVRQTAQTTTEAVKVLPFATEVQSFRVVSAQDWKGVATCSDAEAYPADDSRSTSVSFDDGPQSKWPITSAGTIEITDADFANKISPQYPSLARMGQVEGDSTVIIVVNPNGSVAAASIYLSSGDQSLDQASLNAARQTTFKPAHLSAALGGAPIRSIYLIVYVFNLNM